INLRSRYMWSHRSTYRKIRWEHLRHHMIVSKLIVVGFREHRAFRTFTNASNALGLEDFHTLQQSQKKHKRRKYCLSENYSEKLKQLNLFSRLGLHSDDKMKKRPFSEKRSTKNKSSCLNKYELDTTQNINSGCDPSLSSFSSCDSSEFITAY
ncbi:hypothetical protein IRJ41_023736, partial [Triplophysa rosa]